MVQYNIPQSAPIWKTIWQETALRQLKNGAISLGEALETLPENLRPSVINAIKNGGLTPAEAFESVSNDFNKLGPKAGPLEQYGPKSPTYGPPEMQGPPKPANAPMQGPPRPDQAIGPFKQGEEPKGFNQTKKGLGLLSRLAPAAVSTGIAYGGSALSALAANASGGEFGRNVREMTSNDPSGMAGAMSGDYALGSEIMQGIRDRGNGDTINNAAKIANEKSKSTFSHSKETEQSLRNMDTEKLVRVLAARPNLIPPSEWASSPDLYDLYIDTRKQLQLPTNEGAIKTKTIAPKVEENNTEVNDVGYGPAAVSPYANLQRIDETQPVATVKKQEETRAGQLGTLLQDTIRGLSRGSYGNPDLSTPQDVLERRLTPGQMAKHNADVAKTKEALAFYNDPEVQKFLLSNPLAMQRANGDPFAVIEMVKNEANKPKEEGVAAIAARPSMEENASPSISSPNPVQSSVGGGNEYGAGNTEIPQGKVSAAGELSSLQELNKKYPVQSTPSVARTTSRPSTYTMDPLTRKAYAPVTTDYTSDQAIRRSGEGGQETPLDFIANAPIYQKRLQDQAPAEARGGSIQHGGNAHDSKCHVGIIHMAVGGRTDHLPMNVYANSYVIPADVVSGLGEGNTLAGGKVLDHMFSGESLQKLVNKTIKNPLRRSEGGETAPQKKQDIVMTPVLKLPSIDLTGGPLGSKIEPFRPSSPNYGPGAYQIHWSPNKNPAVTASSTSNLARGGVASDRSLRPVEIIAAGGEYVVPPEVIRALGHGDADAGHKWMDNFVKSSRAHTIKTMQNLPGPKKD